MRGRRFTRRDFLKTTLVGAGLLSLEVLLDACNYDLSKAVPTGSPVAVASDHPTSTSPVSIATSTPQASSTAAETTRASTDMPSATPDLVVVRGGEPEDLVRRAVAALGNMDRFIQDGANVVVKHNICVANRTYEYAATTNPWIVAALVKMAFEAGAGSVKVMDYPFNGTCKQAYRTSGIQEQVEAAGGEMVLMDASRFIPTQNPSGQLLTLVAVFEDVLNADVLINVPVAKNHGSQARLTLGMKNLMGVVQDRGAVHVNLVQGIADLATLIRPQLTVIDAVRILTRNGPSGGRLADVQKLDTVIASPDIVAADSYAASLFGISPAEIAYIRIATEMGLGRSDLENLKIQEIS